MVTSFKNSSYNVTGIKGKDNLGLTWNFSCFMLKATCEISSLGNNHI